MRIRILLLVTILVGWALFGLAQPGKVATAQTGAAAKASNTVDPDQAYKAHCARCHLAPRKFPEGKTVTIMRHMRVRANLTDEEAEAILRYLTR